MNDMEYRQGLIATLQRWDINDMLNPIISGLDNKQLLALLCTLDAVYELGHSTGYSDCYYSK